MDLLKILTAHGIEGASAEAIEAAIKKDIHTGFIPKQQYNKKVQELDAVRTENDDFKARAEQPNEFEVKYNDALKELDALKGEYEGYKADITHKETISTINSKITKLLNEDGYTNEKVVNLLLKNLDYNNITVENDDLKGFDLREFTKGYEEFKTVISTEGTPGKTPPTTGPAKPITRETLENMSAAEINANWGSISQSLANIQ